MGGGAEDMEGRSGLTLLLRKSRYHTTAVLSLTLVYIIFFLGLQHSTCAAGREEPSVCTHQVPDRSVPVSE